MLDDAAGALRGACVVVTNVRDRDLADQVDNQSSDFVSAHIGTLPTGARAKPTQGHDIAQLPIATVRGTVYDGNLPSTDLRRPDRSQMSAAVDEATFGCPLNALDEWLKVAVLHRMLIGSGRPFSDIPFCRRNGR